MLPSVAAASEARSERLLDEEIGRRVDLLLANFERVTANPRSMGYLRFLLRYYAKKPHPFTACVHDNMKRFGPGRTEAVCATLKDTIRQSTHWRHGAPKGPHPGHPDAGAPGVAIAEADKGAAPAWGGHHRLSDEREPSLLDEMDAEFGVVDHSGPTREALDLLCELSDRCDPYRVLLGLDDPPSFGLREAA